MAITQITDHGALALARLATQFRKPGIQALVAAHAAQTQAAENALWAMIAGRGVLTATAATLSLLGAQVGQPRPLAGPAAEDDDAYRALVLARAVANASHGRTEDALAVLRHVVAGDVRIQEGGALLMLDLDAFDPGNLADLVTIGELLVPATPPIRIARGTGDGLWESGAGKWGASGKKWGEDGGLWPGQVWGGDDYWGGHLEIVRETDTYATQTAWELGTLDGLTANADGTLELDGGTSGTWTGPWRPNRVPLTSKTITLAAVTPTGSSVTLQHRTAATPDGAEPSAWAAVDAAANNYAHQVRLLFASDGVAEPVVSSLTITPV